MLNQRELDVLEILWKAGEPLIATEIVVGDRSRELTQSTVTAVLRKLLNGGLVEVDGVKHSGKVLSRCYKPTEKSKEAILDNIAMMYESVKSIVTVDEVKARLDKSVER